MAKRVVMTRRRVIEEKAVITVEAADPEDASAVAQHLVNTGCQDWEFSKTVKESEPFIEILDTKSK